METGIHAIGPMIALLGSNHQDPGLQTNRKLPFALKCHFKSYKKDPSPTCIVPLPVKLIKLAVDACHASDTKIYTCIVDMIIIGFFFQCYPGELTVTFTNKPFKLSMSYATKTTNL